jgi:hypothetical protein
MYREIPVFKAEAEAGLYEAIQAHENRSIASFCPILTDDIICDHVKEEVRVKEKSSVQQSIALNTEEQFDLQYIYAILATTGWNRNDDVFDSYEMWSARNTAEDKPFNKGHDPNNIIGHITGNAVVDENYELVNNHSEVDSLPQKFHILTSAVIYKHISSKDAKLAEETKALLQEISSGKWFVSMEALFSDFDYALMSAQGEQTVVSRNEETAFLSKHLRAYGGAGEFEGSRVGRIMRSLTFSGKGLVENPGNPESIIFKEEDNLIFKGVASSTPETNLLVTSSSKGESSMSDNNEQVRSLQAQVESLEARLKELDEEKIQAQISTFQKASADKDAEINELKSKLDAANEAIEASNESAEELKTAKVESDKSIAELEEKLNAIEAENLKTSRVSTLVDKGVGKAEAESLVETFAGITDEQFETLVLKLSEAPHWPGHKDEDDKKKKKNGKKDEEEDSKAGGMKKKYADKAETSEEATVEAESTEDAEVAEALQNAEAEEAPALAAQSEDESDAVVASLNTYFSEVLGNDNKES